MGQEVFDPQTADGAAVARWLHCGLVAYKEKKTRWAFGPLALHIGHRDDVAHDLLGIFETLSDEAKERWRKAVVALLSDSDIALEPETASTVIDIAVLIGADEILDVLPAIIGEEHAPSSLFLNRVVDAVFQLSGKADSAVACLYAASGSSEFPPASAGLVLMALCRLAPDRWIDHARHLTPAIKSLGKARLDIDSATLHDYVSKVAALVTRQRLVQDWPLLKSESGLLWLRKALEHCDPSLEREPSIGEVLEATSRVHAVQLRIDAGDTLPEIFGGDAVKPYFAISAWPSACARGDEQIIRLRRSSGGVRDSYTAEWIALSTEVARSERQLSRVGGHAVVDPTQGSLDPVSLYGERSVVLARELVAFDYAVWRAKLSERHWTRLRIPHIRTLPRGPEPEHCSDGMQIDRIAL